MDSRGITVVEVIVAVLILTCGLTALAKVTAGAVRATTMARVMEASHATLEWVVDSLRSDGTPGTTGRRAFPEALGPGSAAPLTVEWVVPEDPARPARAWATHRALRDPVEIPFVVRAPW